MLPTSPTMKMPPKLALRKTKRPLRRVTSLSIDEQTPEEELLVVTRVREHLYDCIENKMMKHFPVKKRKCTNKPRNTTSLLLLVIPEVPYSYVISAGKI